MIDCELKEQPRVHTLSVRFRAPVQDLPQHFGRIYGRVLEYLILLGEAHAGAAFAAYHNMDMQDLDVEAGFPVSRPLAAMGDIHPGEIPGGLFAIGHYTGPYDRLGPAYTALTEFIQQQGYAICGPAFEWYLNGPETPPEDLKTDIVFPVMPAEEPVAG